MLGAAAALLALIGIGVGVGVAVSHNHNSNKSASSSGSGSGSGNNGSVVPQTDPNDPSTFVKDSRLHQVFYGLAYTPTGSQLPNCGNSLSELTFVLSFFEAEWSCRRCYHGYSGTQWLCLVAGRLCVLIFLQAHVTTHHRKLFLFIPALPRLSNCRSFDDSASACTALIVTSLPWW